MNAPDLDAVILRLYPVLITSGYTLWKSETNRRLRGLPECPDVRSLKYAVKKGKVFIKPNRPILPYDNFAFVSVWTCT